MAAVFEVSLEQHPRKKGARLIQIGRFVLAAALEPVCSFHKSERPGQRLSPGSVGLFCSPS
jgi:hypothetical protein